jgi:hypothetical protein
MIITKLTQHVLDGEFVPRCGFCLQQGRQCIDHDIPRRWGEAIDHCSYYTSQRVELAIPTE